MSPKNELKNLDNDAVIQEFIKYKTVEAPVAPKTLKTQVGRVSVLIREANKPFAEVTKEDILKHLENKKPSSRNAILVTIKSFYRWYCDLDVGERLPDCVRTIKPIKIKHDDMQYRERIVKPEEYQKLIDNITSPMHRAMLEVLNELGPRATELLSMNGDGATFDGTFTKIVVWESKTKTREVIHKGRCNFLMTYAESYAQFRNQKGKPLFVGYQDSRFTIDGLEQFIKRECKKVGIKKITPHDFRHTAISRDRASGVPDTHIETKFGLTHGSQVLKIYDHNKNKDYENWLTKDGVKTEETYDELKTKTHTIEKQEQRITELENTLHEALETMKVLMEATTGSKSTL